MVSSRFSVHEPVAAFASAQKMPELGPRDSWAKELLQAKENVFGCWDRVTGIMAVEATRINKAFIHCPCYNMRRWRTSQ